MQWNIVHLNEIDSTNDYVKENIHLLPAPSFIYADYQTKGRGQQNTAWYSEPNQNLLCSILLSFHLPVQDSNYLSRWISIILVNTLNQLSIPLSSIKIKWPNDIIVSTPDDTYKKIAGILIENIVEAKYITKTIIGIGLNINQTEFKHLNKIATSVKLLTQQTWSIQQVIKILIENINHYSSLLLFQKKHIIHQEYIQYLYGWQTEFLFKQNNHIFKGRIEQLLDDGKIIVKVHNQEKIFTNKEIEFIL